MRLSISRVAQIIIVFAVLANVALLFMYLGKGSELASLDTELDEARDVLSVYEGNVTALQEQLSAAQLRVTEEKLAIAEAEARMEEYYSAKGVTESSILNSIVELVLKSNVEILEISTQIEEHTEGSQVYSSLSIDLSITGSLPSLTAFIDELENKAIKVVVIDTISFYMLDDSLVANLLLSVFYSSW